MSSKKKKPTNPPRPQRRNASEVLYAFTGFLTTRDLPLIFSKRHDAAPIAEIVQRFIRANRLPKVRDNVPKMRQPVPSDHLTNVQSQVAQCAVAPPPQRPEDVVLTIMRTLHELSKWEQDIILADVLSRIKHTRTERLDHARKMQLGSDIDYRKAQEEMDNLDRVMRGDIKPLYLRSRFNDSDNG